MLRQTSSLLLVLAPLVAACATAARPIPETQHVPHILTHATISPSETAWFGWRTGETAYLLGDFDGDGIQDRFGYGPSRTPVVDWGPVNTTTLEPARRTAFLGIPAGSQLDLLEAGSDVFVPGSKISRFAVDGIVVTPPSKAGTLYLWDGEKWASTELALPRGLPRPR